MIIPYISNKELVLPNAEHINRVLAHAFKEPHKWRHFKATNAWATAEQTAVLRMPHYVHTMLVNRARMVMLPPNLMDFAQDIVTSIADAIAALTAWTDCAYMLDLHPDVVRTLAGSGNHAAILLLPGIIAMNGDDDGSNGTPTEGIRPKAI